jgi:hypothetical protein
LELELDPPRSRERREDDEEERREDDCPRGVAVIDFYI